MESFNSSGNSSFAENAIGAAADRHIDSPPGAANISNMSERSAEIRGDMPYRWVPRPRPRGAILIVEPYDPARNALVALLSDVGQPVLAVRNVEQAESVAAAQPDGIRYLIADESAFDVPMRTLVAILRQRAPGLRLVLVSGLGAGVIATHAQGIDVLSLPAEIEALFARVRD
jgi:hypothetical protein